MATIDLLQRRRQMIAKRGDEWAITQESNPKLMAICYNQGWASRPDKMSFAECAAVTVIGDGVAGHSPFYNCNIETFDEFRYFTGITTILSYTFVACYQLTSIIFPNSIRQIDGDGVQLEQRTQVVVNEGLERLQGWRSLSVANEQLILPSTLQSCGYYTFYYSPTLKSLVVNATTPPKIQSTSFNFYNRHSLEEICVPEGAVDVYKNSTYWSTYKDIIKAI